MDIEWNWSLQCNHLLKTFGVKLRVLPVYGFTGYEGLLCFGKQKLYWFGLGRKIQSKQTRKILGVNPLTWMEWWQTWLKEMTNDIRNVFLAAFSTVFHVVKRFVEHFQSQRWTRGVQRDQPESCNRRLRRQNIPLSCITSLPLSTNGSAIQFHTSWLRLRQTLIWDWGSIPQQRQSGTRSGGLRRRDGLMNAKETKMEGGDNVRKELLWLSSTAEWAYD